MTNATIPFLRRAALRWLLLTLLLAPATYPLWQPHVLLTHDGLHHLARLYEMDIALRNGVLYPRWFPHMGFLYGFPVFHYYAPLTYYVGEVVHLLGGGVLLAHEATLGLGLIAAGWSMYGFARRWGEAVGWLAALLYVYWPYHLANGLVRGAQAELWAMVWFPVLLVAVRQVVRARTSGAALRGGLLFALVYALLMLTHNISAHFFTPVLLAYGLWEMGTRRGQWAVQGPARRGNLLELLLTHESAPLSLASSLSLLLAFWALGLALSAFFWLPALADISWVRASTLQEGIRLENARLLFSLPELMSPFWLQRYLPEQGTTTFHPIPRVAAWLWLLGAAGGLLNWRRNREAAWTVLFFVGATLVAVFMMHRASALLWLKMPLVSYLGPPYRFQALVALAGAVTAALGLGSWLLATNRPAWAWSGVLGIALVLAVSGAARLPRTVMTLIGDSQPLTEDKLDLAAVLQFDFQIGLAARDWGSTWFYEYLPTWVQTAATQFFLPPSVAPQPERTPALRVRSREQTPLRRVFQASSPAPWTLRLHQFYFPAWQVLVDGQAVETAPSGPLGLLSARVPAGDHTVTIFYGATPSQRLGEAIALAATLLWVLGAWRWRRGLLLASLVPLLAFVAVAAGFGRGSGSRLGTRVQEIRWEDPIRLGDQVLLTGAALLRTTVSPGERIWAALDWLALSTPRRRYKVLLHLEDKEGHKWATGDTEPGLFFTPTTRWQAGEIMEDWVGVTVPPDAPPGSYRLLTGMYDAETVQNLPITGGVQMGGRLLLAEVQVR